MKEADIRLQLHHALQWLGYWPYHHQDARYCPRCHNIIAPEVKGRPDTEARHPRFPTALIEVKAIAANNLAIALDSITPEQREYLDSWSLEEGGSYLCIGKIIPMGSKSKIHEIVVVEWEQWKNIELVSYAHGRKSTSWDYKLYTKKVDESVPCIVESLDDKWFLIRSGNEWHFHTDHPLHVQQEIQNPFFKRFQIKEQ